MIFLEYRPQTCPRDRLGLRPFVVEFYSTATELQRRRFSHYRDALAFALQRAGKRQTVSDGVPAELRRDA